MSKKIILTGGGSAGHVTPNLALYPTLMQDGFEILYIGTKNGIEKQLVQQNNIEYVGISAGKLRRYFSLKTFIDPFKILRGYFQSKKLIRKFQPDVVFSKGGFVTVPVVFAAHKLKKPVVIHESDFTPGLANKLNIPRSDKVCVSFEATAKYIPPSKCVVTGSPVRNEILAGNKNAGLSFLGFNGSKPVLLIMGGSLGAQAVNDAVDGALKELIEIFDIAHIRGETKLNPELNGVLGYKQYEYISEELADIFAATDVMLSRAGANAVFEILALSLPALLIPLPKESSRGDQILNAEYFNKKGFSMVLDQGELTPQTLVKSLKTLHANSDTYKKAMQSSGQTNGTQNVIKVIFETIK